MTNLTEIVGTGAGILTSVSLLPQLIKIIQQKKAQDISYLMLFILIAGLCCWVAYGIMKKDNPVIFTNGFSVIINSLMIVFSLKYKKRSDGNL